MWHDNLLKLIEASNLTKQQIAERGNLPYETVKRVISKKTPNPYIETLDRFAIALGCTLGDILIDTKAVIGTENLTELQETIDIVTAELDLIKAENAILKEENTAIKAKNELLTMQLMHKEELLALHNYYNKLNQNK